MLIVGEGYAEQYLLCHIRSLYTANRQGPQLTVMNARGKGAANVVETAIVHARAYDSAGALFDTDTDWNTAVERRARKNGIHLFAATPCIEALLLEIGGFRAAADTADNKRLFRDQFGGDAHREGLIARHFSRETLDAAKDRVATLTRILDALR